MKRIAILGSTGSIGVNTLEVISYFPQEFKVVALTANSNLELLRTQIKTFKPKMVCFGSEDNADLLIRKGNIETKVYFGQDGIKKMLRDKGLDLVVVAISGSAALLPLLEAIRNKKDVALANKEALVMAGSIIMKEARKSRVRIIPIDSEQSAIFQCLEGKDRSELRKIYLTASGGPLWDNHLADFDKIKPSDVLNHPRWKMGKKITVDSATLMNKGLEVIEAGHLFCLDVEDIQIIIHKQAIVHSMVELIDGAIIAQLGITDMRLPIQYALSFPKRLPNPGFALNLGELQSLTFEEPDLERFTCLGLAFWAAKQSGTAPAVLNAANEVAVDAFLNNRLNFSGIPRIIEEVLKTHKIKPAPGLDEILSADQWARQRSRMLIAKTQELCSIGN
ncbi:MAG: 1-deoxy-D-xylulose-5-phosphate reductoisomerase [Candidatus Omnitrophota bacterium]